MNSRIYFRTACAGAVIIGAMLACQSNAVPTATAVPTAQQQPAESTTVPVVSQQQHVDAGVAPGDLPASRLDQAGDVSSSKNAAKKMAPGGDVFVQGLYERPFNANTMDTYLPYVDIVDTQGFKDDTWGYATITLVGPDASGKLSANYAVEIDVNKDGRGDWLVIASAPASTVWTTAGVQIWQDADGDVGGSKPMVADKKLSTGNAYETLVFDQGKGDVPDAAWVRISKDDPNTVQIAFRLASIGNPASYAMGAWAGTAALDPAKFDFNDHMSHADAGSPLPSYQTYPLKGLAEIDNTCRLAIGFAATGNEPGLCKTIKLHESIPTPRPTPVPSPTPIIIR